MKVTDMQRSAFPPQNFVISILAVGAGLGILGNVLALGFKIHLGLALFILGILSMGIGNILSLPGRRYERRSGIRHINLFKLPAPEEYLAEKLFVAKHSAPFYSFENALLFAGFIILLIGLIVLF
jgi:hypothetical protein